jgi:hypothetical protein
MPQTHNLSTAFVQMVRHFNDGWGAAPAIAAFTSTNTSTSINNTAATENAASNTNATNGSGFTAHPSPNTGRTPPPAHAGLQVRYIEVWNEPEGAFWSGSSGARFRQKFTLEDAIEFHAFAPFEVLPCV